MLRTLTFASALFAATITAVTAQAAVQKASYSNPYMVEVIARGEVDRLPGDQTPQNLLNAHYVLGFSAWFGSRCDVFAPSVKDWLLNGYENLREQVDRAEATAEQKTMRDAIANGINDARVFLAEHGCQQEDAQRASTGLRKVMNDAFKAPKPEPSQTKKQAASRS